MPFQALQGTCRAWQPAIKVTVRVTCRTRLQTQMILGLIHTPKHLLENSFPQVLPLPSNVRRSWGIVGWNNVGRSHEPILPRIQHLHRRWVSFIKDVPCAHNQISCDVKFRDSYQSLNFCSDRINKMFLGRQLHPDVEVLWCFRDKRSLHPYGLVGGLVKPQLMTRCPTMCCVYLCLAWASPLHSSY